ncbi:hypothetical protein V5N11_023759 [Cardamine amara subsp. amara]|uniref:TRF2/HOY1 PH-like domain-containing protein n=1 Tax=Cardamine amara subsp. amara TaxID=228776 RepID=A0ABD1AYI5_CARAN
MERSGEEPQGANNNIIVDEVQYPRLNLPLTKTPELINSIETYLQQLCPCPQQKTSTCPKNTEKIKAMNFPVSKITIGQWTTDSVYDDDIVAKFYFSKKRLLWEFLVPDKQETHMGRLKRKIEILWDDVLSLKRSFHSRDETGILEVELRKRPTFCIETNPQAGKHTQWKEIQDFTDTQASLCRRHTLHFKPGVLQKNFEKLVSSNSFWSELVKVPFPLLKSPYFDIAYENNNNSISFNADNDFQHYHPFQGTGHVGGGNFNMATHLWPNDGMQINSYGQANSGNNIANEYRGMQATLMSSQVIDEHYNTGVYFTSSQCSNLMIQDNGEMQNREGLLGSQEYELPDSQTNLLMNQHMNEFSMYPPSGSYLESTLLQEEERQHMEYTHLGGNVQIDGYQQKSFYQSGDNYSYPYMSSNNFTYMSSNNGPVIADMKDDFNDEEI